MLRDRQLRRVEIIDEDGRSYARRNVAVMMSYQDFGTTLKLFVSGRSNREDAPSPVSAEEVAVDLEAMRAAIAAFENIPTSQRRALALSWFIDRVNQDIDELRTEELRPSAEATPIEDAVAAASDRP